MLLSGVGVHCIGCLFFEGLICVCVLFCFVCLFFECLICLLCFLFCVFWGVVVFRMFDVRLCLLSCALLRACSLLLLVLFVCVVVLCCGLVWFCFA